MSGDQEKRRFSLVLVRAAVNAPKQEELDYLLDELKDVPVSVYCLPAPNLFDFALVGNVSPTFALKLVVESYHEDFSRRYDIGLLFPAYWYVYRGKRVHEERDLPDSAFDQGPEKGRFCAMLLWRSAIIHDEEGRERFCGVLAEILEEIGGRPDYCLASLEGVVDLGQKEPSGPQGRYEFGKTGAFRDCNTLLRVSRDVDPVEPPSRCLDWLHRLHYGFRLKIDKTVTTICFAVSAQRLTAEVKSRKSTCMTALSDAYKTDIFEMAWFGFERDVTSPRLPPNVPLPLGNHVITAAARIGKTNAALALIDAYSRWTGMLTMSPGYGRFDILYVNLKSGSGAKKENLAVDCTNEAKLLKAFLVKKRKLANCVRPSDLLQYFSIDRGETTAIAYTESDGTTCWKSTIGDLVDARPSQGPGLLIVFDEAFSDRFPDQVHKDVCETYADIYNTLPSKAVRAILIGQEANVIAQNFPEIKDWIFEKSTVVIARQRDDAVLEQIVYSANNEGIVKWLDCGDQDELNAIADKEKIPFKVGPVIVRPSLFGERCHPIPCHIVPEPLPDGLRGDQDVRWWVPPSS